MNDVGKKRELKVALCVFCSDSDRE